MKAKTPAIPEIYQSLNRDPKLKSLCICLDIHDQLFLHDRRQSINVVKEAQHRVWDNMDKFLDTPKQELLTYHANLFGCEPPKNQDLITTGCYVWFAMCAKATDRRTSTTPRNPETGRKSTIGSRKYFLGEADPTTADIRTPQAKACLKIITDCICEHKVKLDSEKLPGDPYITEEELKKVIIARAAELKTRQDPWRIFQYYRPTLINAKLIKHD